ncbi:hypothetical protein RHSIM_Rhsim07G0222100 [Rhododendron simsii]|uniref:Syntaxin 6/10/61 N-terminal domain-containing protein n=1 Tax=Rhododendron simsii TaxID=118357 RepID=A0A834LKE6_RHOSS|nr:hypothetical protein RHSIM_Rhsim07G0222100 [Rhododendron simsii]
MASNFDRWEKDPFFSAAEEVQESADRSGRTFRRVSCEFCVARWGYVSSMESTYRTWIHSMKDSSGIWNSEELCRDVRTTLGTTKWQLEELERAVKSSYANSSSADAKERHHNFVTAIESQISKIERSLHKSAISNGKPPLPWVRLDEGECNELALFLSGPSVNMDKSFANIDIRTEQSANLQKADKELVQDCAKNSRHSVERNFVEDREEKLPGHRRTASASADIEAWKIAVPDDVFPHNSANGHVVPPPRKVPSLGLLSTLENASKLKWPKNGYRKLKNTDHHQEADSMLSQPQQLTRGIDACYERSKSCLAGCDDCYDNKQLYGWYGAVQRLLQRSQYQMQYRRPLQVVFSIVLLLGLIGELA